MNRREFISYLGLAWDFEKQAALACVMLKI